MLTAVALLASLALTVADRPVPATAQAVRPAVASRINLTQQDLEFILAQIRIGEEHPDGTGTLCVAPDKLTNPLACPATTILQNTLPFGIRQTNGQNNNLIAENAVYGAADRTFPRLTSPVYLAGDATPDMDGPGPMQGGAATSYEQNAGMVFDAEPRLISNLISDQTEHNPAAEQAALETVGHGFTHETVQVDHDRNSATPTITQYVMPNVAPDAGFSASYNSLFTMFGQFFDHGLDLAAKGGNGTVFVPLRPDDPLYDPTSRTNFMVLTRATNQPGTDGILGTDDDVKDATNLVTPYIDNNQTYTSHPSHQVFLREYRLGVTGSPVATGRLLDGAGGGLPSWTEVKAQARDLLGIQLEDADVTNVPLVATDAYGKFIPGADGYPLLVLEGGTMMEGNPAAPVSTAGLDLERSGHAFLDDIAHHAAPGTYDHDHNPATPALPMVPDQDTLTTDDRDPSTYDDELLGLHYITGDGRGNENIGLTAMHHIFHQEHNGLVGQLQDFIPTLPAISPAALPAWKLADGTWNGERLFQAAKLINEMEYQHIVFGEFARAIQPAVNLFDAYDPSADPAITAEFAHAVYRFGHSMLTETVARTQADGTAADISLMDAFLNPLAFTDDGSGGLLTADQGAGAIIRGMVNQRGEAIDEFVTEALRNNLVGLPLDLATLNITRARSEGIAPLNQVRRDLFNGTVSGAAGNTSLRPYRDWTEFGMALRHEASLVNFLAAYGTHPSITGATTIDAKRAAAQAIVDGTFGAPADAQDFLDGTGSWTNDVDGRAITGLEEVDLWIGGLAEKPPLFGGMLGSTFNFVFEHQMEALQNNDRLYYLARAASLPLLAELEGNTMSDLIRRNTDAENVPVMAFTRSDWTFDLGAQTNPTGIVDDPNTPYLETNLDGTARLQRLTGGTIRLKGNGTTENHSTWLGTNGDDKVRSAEGDDSLWGNDGNDQLEGGVGGDMLEGGAGNDVLTDEAGDDVVSGGDGADVLHGGAGLDVLSGDNGDDAIFHGSDASESMGGQGHDLIVGGVDADAEGGGPGQDWLEGGGSGDFLVGDERAAFALIDGEDDVLIGGSGDDRYLAEGGMDIMMIGTGVDTSNGGLGFDFASYAQAATGGFGDLSLPPLAVGGVANPRDRFTLTEGISGGSFDDTLRGDDRVRAVGHNLTPESMATVTGLEDLLRAAQMLNSAPTNSMFGGDDIVIGGGGSDMLEGGGGADLIDGDAFLDVQLTCVANDGSTTSYTSVSLAQGDLLNGRLSPDQCDIDRSIQYPNDLTGIDTAVYRFPMDQYFIGQTPDGRTVVSHVPAGGGDGGGGGGGGGGGEVDEGTDVLLNIEQLQFADGTVQVAPPGGDTGSPTGWVAIDNTFPTVGDVLTADASNVSDPVGIDPTTEVFWWQAMVDFDPIFQLPVWSKVGDGQQYLVQPTDVGNPLQAVYEYHDINGTFQSLLSDPTWSVLPAGGVVPAGAQLALVVPDAVTDPTITVSAQFVTPGVGGAAGTPIEGAVVDFDVNGVVASGVTGPDGVATVLVSVTDVAPQTLLFTATATDPLDPTVTVVAAPVERAIEYAAVSLLNLDPVMEGNTPDVAQMTAVVALDFAVAHDVTVSWTATAGTATDGADFTATSGTATILAGDVEAAITVDVLGDDLVEADETVDIGITGITGGVLSGPAGTVGAIIDDDLPTISLGADQAAPEAAPGGGANSLTFEVTLDQVPVNPASIDFTLVSGTAEAGTDFLVGSGTIAFEPGQQSSLVVVTLVDDTEIEFDETFTLELDPLSVVGATPPVGTTITGTIVDDDAPFVTAGPAVSVLEGARNARTPLNFSVQLDRPSVHPVTVDWTLGGGTARAGTDYVRASGTATIQPGALSAIVGATIIGDSAAERNETFDLTISLPQNAVLGQASATGTILDDDTRPSATIDDVAVTEGNSGTKTATFTITLSKAPTAAVSVLAEAVAGTARIPSDIRSFRSTVRFAAGQRTATIAISVVGDLVREPNETYSVRLSRASGVTLADSSGKGTVLNDDRSRQLSRLRTGGWRGRELS